MYDEYDNYENVMVGKGEFRAHISRWIGSWLLSGGRLDNMVGVVKFKQWLKIMELTDEEIQRVDNYLFGDKEILKDSAEVFIKRNAQIDKEMMEPELIICLDKLRDLQKHIYNLADR